MPNSKENTTSSDEKVQKVDDIEYHYSSKWINRLESLAHWKLYWFQQKLLEGLVKPGDKVLEIGPGTGFCTNYLRSKDVDVKTLDIDKAKKPDICCNIVECDLSSDYDHILAFEVFEHIPFDKFLDVLSRIKNHSPDIILSLPLYSKRVFEFDLFMPFLNNLHFCIRMPKKRLNQKHHFWEVGYKSFTEKYLQEQIKGLNLRIVRRETYLSKLFFILET